MRNIDLIFKGNHRRSRDHSSESLIIFRANNRDKPHYSTLTNDKKTQSLIQEIQKANISKEDKDFLIKAAHRHTVFDYGKIAEYYAHSDKEVQELMEKSALVIIDFNKAIEYGYVKLSDEVAEQYKDDYDE